MVSTSIASYVATMSGWKNPGPNVTGLPRTVSSLIYQAWLEDPHTLPELRAARDLVLVSDYGGEHKEADYLTYAFLLTDLEQVRQWNATSQAVRRHFLSDGRRMAYKRLGEGQRRAALGPFLDVSDRLPGLLLVLAIARAVDRRVRRVEAWPVPDYEGWSRNGFEKAHLIVNLASVLVAGLSTRGQNIIWITDQDAIAPNPPRLTDLTRMFGHICSHYLSHDLGHMRIGTTAVDDGTRSVEDLVALPDLAAGATAETLRAGRFMGPSEVKEGAEIINAWLGFDRQPLRKLVYRIDPSSEPGRVNVGRIRHWATARVAL